jgi:guanine deaminase
MPTEQQIEFMRRAIALATENVLSARGGPFGAVIVHKGQILAEAANSVTTTNDPTAHAEINAIRLACSELGSFSLEGCDIYSSCEPCPMCLAAIYWAHIKAIYFGNSATAAARADFRDAALYRELALPREGRSIPSTQILADEAVASFQAWQASPSKIEY